MCKIRYIQRENGVVKKDCVVRVDYKDFDLVDKPYFIVRDDYDNKISFKFHYLDVNEETEVVSENIFMLRYGLKTGRLQTLELNRDGEDWVKLELWNSFGKILPTRIQGDILNKVQYSFDIVQRLYFKKYEEVKQEDSCNNVVHDEM